MQRRAPWLRAGRAALIFVVVIAGLVWAGQRVLQPALDLADVRIAVVERGTLRATVSSTGAIVPRAEHTVSSPVGAEIRIVHVAPGERVREGQLMIELDTTLTALALSNLEEELALKRAEIRSVDLQHTDSIRQAQSRRDLLAIDLQSREVMLERLQRLAGEGIVSATELLEAELNVKRTEVELDQVAAQIISLGERREADLERLDLDYSILDKRRADQARRVAMSAVRATRDGIVTFLVRDEGVVVSEGQALATIAAEDEFRVEASVSAFYGPQLRPNQRVVIESSAQQFGGYLSRILPVAESNRLDLFIEFDDPMEPAFHTNLSVDIEIITAEKHDVLKLRRGPALEGGGIAQLFRIQGGRAVKTPVRLGVSERQEIEVLDGLQAGDRVIVSDVSAVDQHDEIRIYE